MDSLTKRRKLGMLLYLHKLVNGVLDDSALLSMLDFAVPRPNSRSVALFPTDDMDSGKGSIRSQLLYIPGLRSEVFDSSVLALYSFTTYYSLFAQCRSTPHHVSFNRLAPVSVTPAYKREMLSTY
ncbi:hypothetical protein J6590_037057 [Homalodisca vitripennis]|nr:hypothetical protein J6590_037057 [Homalodisca vitripennis]